MQMRDYVVHKCIK